MIPRVSLGFSDSGKTVTALPTLILTALISKRSPRSLVRSRDSMMDSASGGGEWRLQAILMWKCGVQSKTLLLPDSSWLLGDSDVDAIMAWRLGR